MRENAAETLANQRDGPALPVGVLAHRITRYPSLLSGRNPLVSTYPFKITSADYAQWAIHRRMRSREHRHDRLRPAARVRRHDTRRARDAATCRLDPSEYSCLRMRIRTRSERRRPAAHGRWRDESRRGLV